MKCACPTAAAKRYRYTVLVQIPSGTADAHGHIDLTDSSNWTTLGNIRVNFKTKGSRERFIVDQLQSDVTCIAETPSTALSRSIQPECRIQFDSRTFHVTGVYDVNEERQVVHLYLTEMI